MTGWKLVPHEPTEEMIDQYSLVCPSSNIQDAERIYTAMLAAAPEPPEEVVERVARRLAEGEEVLPFDKLRPGGQYIWRSRARAAIRALKEDA